MTHREDEAARRSRLSCIDSSTRWRRQARFVRDHAATLGDARVRAGLERSAESCDQQAAWWLDAAIGEQVAQA